MNDPVKDLEKRIDRIETRVNQDLTIVLGQNTRTNNELSAFRTEVSDRLTRLDDRLTEAHKDIAQLELGMQSVNKRLDGMQSTLDQILARLPNP